MTPDKGLSKIFKKFAGKELMDPNRLATVNDPVLDEMKQVAQANGLKLRVWFPGMMGTMDARFDRVNAIVREQNGKLIVQPEFKRG